MYKKTISIFFVALILVGTLSAAKRPKNVIFLIGDGMGIAQIYAAMVSNGNSLELERCEYMGYTKTYSLNGFSTDSGASGTALATGVKTKNGMIGMGPDSIPVETILQQASRNGLATGIVVACALTHATPAAFIAHQVNRGMEEEIAADYLKTQIDVFIGGGRKYFENRRDGRNLTTELRNKNYQIAYSLDEASNVTSGKLAGLLFNEHPANAFERGDFLPDATTVAIDILNKSKNGFFLMVEGSQIDWAGHENDIDRIIKETLDFDKTVGRALDFAEKDGQTLVIVTADHETGGLTLPDGNIREGSVKASFSTNGHSGLPVPIFAYGPGAEEFIGFMENTDIKSKIEKLLSLK